jgi:hypothetical protein
MTPAKLLAIAMLGASLAVSTAAFADSARVKSLRADVQSLETRSHAIRRRAEHAGSEVRRESERVVAVVDRRCLSASTRLSLVELLGDEADATSLDQIETTLQAADRLLARAVSWYGIRPLSRASP